MMRLGPEPEGLAGLTPGDFLMRWSAGWPGRPALVDLPTGVRLTFAELDREAERVAAGLQALGLAPKDRVAYWMADRPEAVVLLYAANRAGLVWVPVNYRLTPHEALAQLRHAAPRALVVDAERADATAALIPSLPSVQHLVVVGADRSAPFVAWTDLLNEIRPPGTSPETLSPAGILYTSGTTGLPKGAVHSHATLLGWCLAMAHAARWSWADRIVIPYPLFHMGGVGFVMTALTVGATAVLPGRPAPERLLATVADEAATCLVAPPTVLNNLVRQSPETLARYDWSRLRRLATTSAPLWEETARALLEQWPHLSLTEIYSATEALFSFLDGRERSRHPRSVGRPALGMAIQIRNDEGQAVPAGTPGLIWGRGPSVFTGYLSPGPALPAAGRWHTCYDVGYCDAEGYLYIVDRQNDLINSGGEKISSGEVEDLLLRHPAVFEAAVIGVPDPLWGERVHAVVSLKPGAAVAPDEILAWCRGRLAGFKLPKTLRIVDELPKNTVGKLLKRVLREQESGRDPPL
jgi:acyl-CoA synthetase (AMP-forming)/AMP-acid ligase II